MTKEKKPIDLTLLKRLVSELETMLTASEAIDSKANKDDLVVEMSKAAGIAAGVMSEAMALIGDIQYVASAGTGSVASGQDLLGKLMSGFKGPGNAN